MKRISMVGRSFGLLTVLRDLESKSGQKKSRVLARCACGAEQTFTASDLRTGNTTSCGCARRAMHAARLTKHGHSKGSPEFMSWTSMRSRCNTPTNKAYANYGGRGITVCERWNDFKAFLSDMGPRPHGASLDRFPDNDGNYEPTNCRWATPAEQARNRRSTINLTLNGETKCLLDWCVEKNANYDMALWWIRVRGISPCDALARSAA
jgi:hypothetical protein